MNISSIPPRIPVTRSQIERVVARFYARVRVHKILGPVFNGIISTDAELWRVHEAKITAFWANALLHEREYNGNPMMVHAGISAIEPSMFEDWLALFDEVLAAELPPERAAQWSALAHRIGQGLRFGLTAARGQSGPPVFD